MTLQATPSSSEAASAFTLAQEPFNDPEADLVLRTSDGVDFRVYKLLLTLSSPFFKDLLSLKQPDEASSSDQLYDGSTPIVPITETSDVMDPVLRFCYPFDDPEIKNFSDLVLIADAMRKYEFVQFKRMAKLFCSPSVLEEKPFEAFATVCKLNMPEEVQRAALYTIRIPLPITTPIPELALITGLQYQQLLIYRQRCVEAAKAFIKTRPWRSDVYCWNTCGQCTRSWMNNFINTLPARLEAVPWPTSLTGSPIQTNVSCGYGGICVSSAAIHWEACIKEDIIPRFDEELRKVQIEITY